MAKTALRDHTNRVWVKRHLEEERRESELLGEIREALFGMQDGLVSTLAVVSAVSAATNDRFAVLIAGLASALAGVFSMAAGEYMSSKSQREIYLAQIAGERSEVEERPEESQAEVAYLLEEEGLPRDDAVHVAQVIARYPNVLLRTMVEKELGIAIDEGRGPFKGALVMGVAFGLASLVPIAPYLILPIEMGFWGALASSAVALFAIGIVKARWTKRNPLRSGIEVVALAALAGAAGFVFGNLLPTILGVPAVGG